MKKKSLHIILTVLFMGMVSGLAAQPMDPAGNLHRNVEKLVLLTDRGHYITGEIINFVTFHPVPSETMRTDLNKILYVELITPGGASLVRKKIEFNPVGGNGSLIIPSGISSGTYYLRAYTRWMRNCGPAAFSYTSVQIYDPFKDTKIPVDTTGPFTRRLDEGRGTLRTETGEDQVECKIDPATVDKGEWIDVTLKWKFPYTSARACVSVIKQGIQGKQMTFMSGCGLSAPLEGAFLPEIQGVSLTGQSVSRANGEPADYATIYVSVLGEDRNFFCNYSDSAGRFYFSFPDYTGHRDLFVSTYHPEYPELELLIDRDFSGDVIQLPSFPVLLNDSLLRLITGLSINAQVGQQYYPVQTPVQEEIKADDRLFYGHPSTTIRFDDFIKLPRIEEYFLEVIPQVAVRKNRGTRQFVVQGAHPDLQVYQPLVMIDGVAIFDVEAVLAVSPRLIDRIEIVNAPYIRGNVTFGGIISIISKNRDLGYIDLPSSGLLVNYQMLDRPAPFSGIETPATERLPDIRNTLYWDPVVELAAGEETGFRFLSSNENDEYIVIIRGYDTSGKYFSLSVPFIIE